MGNIFTIVAILLLVLIGFAILVVATRNRAGTRRKDHYDRGTSYEKPQDEGATLPQAKARERDSSPR